MAEQQIETAESAAPDLREMSPIFGMAEEIKQHRTRLQDAISKGMSSPNVARELEATAMAFLEEMAEGSAKLWTWMLTVALVDVNARLEALEEEDGFKLNDEEIEKFEHALGAARLHAEKLLEWNEIVPNDQRLDFAGTESIKAQIGLIDELLVLFAEDEEIVDGEEGDEEE